MLKVIILGLFLLVAIVLSILLQIYLSNRQNKWTGLVIPGICLLLSFFPMLSTPAEFSATKTFTDESGQVISEVVTTKEDNTVAGSEIASMVLIFLVSNIPTAVLLAIYFACREKIKKASELEKMNILDLE